MKIATAPVSWGACEIPGWGNVLPYAQVLDEMAACGFTGTELGPPGYLPRDASVLRRELRARGLALVGAYCPIVARRAEDRAAALATALETAALLADAGGSILVLAEAGDPTRAALAGRIAGDRHAPSFTRAEWDRLCDTANEIARRAKERRVITAFHPHVGSYVESPDEIEVLLAGTEPDLVGLCLDTGHVAYGGGDPAALAREHGRRVRHVHVKDLRHPVHARAVAQKMDFAHAVGEGVFAPLGEGALDLRGTVAALDAAGYGGWYVIEQDVRLGVTRGADPPADAQRSRDFLHRLA